ncbi:hypothetical protein HYC85_018025 [Camellia sinensis]|uniref:Uncharacterized protein n=1 Tax=Camellia sinensis TaxID=4442 RepID=A0A7J7GX13_CAMSI|nr:hypothetical protein HYC85_018025 [Camellia sinensis]
MTTYDTNGTECVLEIDNDVKLFNDQLKSLVDDLNNDLTDAKFICINVTEISSGNLSTVVLQFQMLHVALYPQTWVRENVCVIKFHVVTGASMYSRMDFIRLRLEMYSLEPELIVVRLHMMLILLISVA